MSSGQLQVLTLARAALCDADSEYLSSRDNDVLYFALF